MNKLRTQVLLAINLFLLLTIGGAVLFYSFFAEDYYLQKKKTAILDTFAELQRLDLKELLVEEEVEELILPWEEESLSLLICDKDLNAIYSSNFKATDSAIQENVTAKLDLYSTTPSIRQATPGHWQPLSLYGLIQQENESYYVYINKAIRSFHNSILYTKTFLRQLLVVILILGAVFSYFLSRWIVRPVEQLQEAARRLSKNDLTVRLPDRQPKNELGQLAMDINQMAGKIQHDMNDLNNYNYLLLKQNRNMAEFEDMRKKLVSSFTHELKTPLAIISSQLELLQYEYDPDKKDYYYSSIMEEIDKMSKLISTILRNSKMENQIQNTELHWLNLSEILTGLLPKYENWLSTRKILFQASIEEDCVAYMDRLQIEQAVNNYMMNAVRHTKAGRNVHLTLRSEEKFLYLSVYNDGPRLPSQELDRIWTGFYQSGKTNLEGETEIGLGLYIVKDIISHHNGSCGVENREHGIEFWFRLPKSQF